MMPLLLVAFSAGCDGGTGGSYLYQPAYCLDECLRGPTTPYVPQPALNATNNKGIMPTPPRVPYHVDIGSLSTIRPGSPFA